MNDELEKLRLVYIGKGASLRDVPARDLNELDMFAFELDEAILLKSGLYKKPETENKPASKKVKAGKESE